jgi:hypothetical protein
MLNTLVVSIAKQLVSESVHAVITILSIPERRFLTLSSTPNAGYEACWDVSNMPAFLSGTIFVVHMNRNCSDSSDDTIATQRSGGGVCLFWDDCRPTKTPSSAPTPSPTTGTPAPTPTNKPTKIPTTRKPAKTTTRKPAKPTESSTNKQTKRKPPTTRPTKRPTKKPTKRPSKKPPNQQN